MSTSPVLVTGAAGFVASAIVEALGERAVGLSRAQLDITNSQALDEAIERHRPSWIINGAAWADVDRCERDPDTAWHINVEGPRLLARACKRHQVRFMHISTDYVFSGDPCRIYSPDEHHSPVSHYARTKAAAELEVLGHCPDAVVARVAWVYGVAARGFGSLVPGKLLAGEVVQAIADRHGHPTYVRDIADRVLALLDAQATGIHHVVNQGPTSWYTFAERLAERLHLPAGRVLPVSRETLPPAAPRPTWLSLEDTAYRVPGLAPMRRWQDAQDAFLLELLQRAAVRHPFPHKDPRSST